MRSFIDLTTRFPMSLKIDKLRAELRLLDDAASVRHYDPTQPAQWTTIPFRSINRSTSGPDAMRRGPFEQYRNTAILENLPYMRKVVAAFECPMARIRASRMVPHSAITADRDILGEVASLSFGHVRLHIPIATNDKVCFDVGPDRLHLAAGRLYYVDFDKKNRSLRNDGEKPRVHLFLECTANDGLPEVFPKAQRDRAIGYGVTTDMPPRTISTSRRPHYILRYRRLVPISELKGRGYRRANGARFSEHGKVLSQLRCGLRVAVIRRAHILLGVQVFTEFATKCTFVRDAL